MLSSLPAISYSSGKDNLFFSRSNSMKNLGQTYSVPHTTMSKFSIFSPSNTFSNLPGNYWNININNTKTPSLLYSPKTRNAPQDFHKTVSNFRKCVFEFDKTSEDNESELKSKLIEKKSKTRRGLSYEKIKPSRNIKINFAFGNYGETLNSVREYYSGMRCCPNKILFNRRNVCCYKIPKRHFTMGVSELLECPICHLKVENFKYKTHIAGHPTRIMNGIYLGSYVNACDIDDLRLLNINYILNCASECTNTFPNELHYFHLKLVDRGDFDITTNFDKAFRFIDEAIVNRSNILIHSKLGISRCTAVLVGYMIKKHGYSASVALNIIKSKRSIALPNKGFFEQLSIYEKVKKLKAKGIKVKSSNL